MSDKSKEEVLSQVVARAVGIALVVTILVLVVSESLSDNPSAKEAEKGVVVEKVETTDRYGNKSVATIKSRNGMPLMYTTPTVHGCEIKAMFPMVKATQKVVNSSKAATELKKGLADVGADAYVSVAYSFNARDGSVYTGTPVVLDCEPESPKVDEVDFGLSD